MYEVWRSAGSEAKPSERYCVQLTTIDYLNIGCRQDRGAMDAHGLRNERVKNILGGLDRGGSAK